MNRAMIHQLAEHSSAEHTEADAERVEVHSHDYNEPSNSMWRAFRQTADHDELPRLQRGRLSRRRDRL